jgi:hypothetical protein
VDSAVDQSDTTIGGGGDFRAVGDEDYGGFLLAGEPGDEFDDGGARGGVEIPRGLVGEENGRLMNEGSGQGGALKLTPGELVRPMVRALGKSDGG